MTAQSLSVPIHYPAGFNDNESGRYATGPQFVYSCTQRSLAGMGEANGELVSFVRCRSQQWRATMDQDASLVEARKKEAPR